MPVQVQVSLLTYELEGQGFDFEELGLILAEGRSGRHKHYCHMEHASVSARLTGHSHCRFIAVKSLRADEPDRGLPL